MNNEPIDAIVKEGQRQARYNALMKEGWDKLFPVMLPPTREGRLAMRRALLCMVAAIELMDDLHAARPDKP